MTTPLDRVATAVERAGERVGTQSEAVGGSTVLLLQAATILVVIVIVVVLVRHKMREADRHARYSRGGSGAGGRHPEA